MQHWHLGGLRGVADGRSTVAAPRMSNGERLERWADALELQGLRCLRTIDDSGLWVRARARRAEDSPLTVASEDWALRAEGLDGDSMADALEFFGLSPGQIRRLVGASRHGRSVPAAAVAAALRTLAQGHEAPARPRSRWIATGASAFGVVALALAIPLLLGSL
jgi:hypothetical protein